MATAVITRTQKENRTPIQFHRILRKNDMSFTESTNLKPNQFKYVELIMSRYGNKVGTDLIFAHNDMETVKDGRLFLGDWGDGFVDEKEASITSLAAEDSGANTAQ